MLYIKTLHRSVAVFFQKRISKPFCNFYNFEEKQWLLKGCTSSPETNPLRCNCFGSQTKFDVNKIFSRPLKGHNADATQQYAIFSFSVIMVSDIYLLPIDLFKNYWGNCWTNSLDWNIQRFPSLHLILPCS